jgi:hypothetical protein
MRRSSSSRAAAAMVMTIGELHAGHCIDPSLADAVTQTQRNPLCGTPAYPVSAVSAAANRLDNTPSQGNFPAPDLSGRGTDRVVRPFVVATGQPRQYVFSSEDSTPDTADMTSRTSGRAIWQELIELCLNLC